ncbi:MAG: hypothetical protein A2977_03755 [Alphaproteobacteria bacterium RIFCSPLOWO2_01_FULL_45_8]|nr:MAG: hypothetical protein A2065_03245 [Alphaproteobacteria bacterium GWB1_45_5]OFW76586.1 MAG: hypothetical protein A3K20_00170 [Alphaproteobacteria bacterium GWA1_45_9]OFW89670.1 MAG: hypothetical protein A2621_02060 [Alphaproteobacteria bacterium RIFCSPHIGHO2_01_FULL_41_14]OFW95831.1 MAG: hypothetical protein A2977_03755 [Alphaproteobacteria bacterium RIFCSPLOWO2_01_FULL_45_8]HCI49112.1 hypothetical protein [Holosporales bacterium]
MKPALPFFILMLGLLSSFSQAMTNAAEPLGSPNTFHRQESCPPSLNRPPLSPFFVYDDHNQPRHSFDNSVFNSWDDPVEASGSIFNTAIPTLGEEAVAAEDTADVFLTESVASQPPTKESTPSYWYPKTEAEQERWYEDQISFQNAYYLNPKAYPDLNPDYLDYP